MKNKKLYLALTILFPFWLLASFILIYFFMTAWPPNGWFTFTSFKRYLFFVHPISMILAAYIFTNGNLLNIKNKIKPFIVISSILLVFAFTMIQWIGVTTAYGQYGTSVKNSPNELFLLPDENTITAYEHETLCREAIKVRYETTFNKI